MTGVIDTMTRPHAPALLAGACAALLLASAAQAQVYRNVGPDGKVTFSDQPPTATARPDGGGGAANNPGGGGGALPYELGQVAQRYPVTLYTANNCAACNSGRTLLIARGIPFSEKTVQTNDDIAALQRLSGGSQLPVVTIGSQRLTGYSDQDWGQYLDAAGYPKTSQLPTGYQRPPATPLVDATTVAAPAAGSQPQTPARVTPAESPEANPSIAPVRNSDNPTGIRF